MKQGIHFKRTALPVSAKSMVSLMLLLIAMIVPQEAWAGACAYTPECASIEDMQVHLNGTNGNFNGSANNEVVASLKFNYWLDIFNYDGDNGYWNRDLTMKIDDQTLTFYSDYACTTKVSTDYSTVLQGVWGVFGDSNEDHTIGKNKSGSGNKAYFKTSSGLKGYINIYNYYAASNKWTTMKVEVFIYDLYGHKVSVCGTYKRSGKSDIAYDYVFYLGGCPRPKNVTTSRNTTTKQVTVSWQKETYSIPASDATGETRVKAYNVIDNGNWGVYRNDDYTTSIQTVGNTTMSAADNSASCSSSPYTYYVCYEPKATYKDNGSSLTGSETHLRGLSGSSSITLNHVWGESSWKWDDDGHSATCTRTCTQGDNNTTSVTVKLNNGIASAQQVAPKCTEMGTTRYTATATVGGTQYTSTKDVVDIAALGHGTTGFTESYSWTGNAYNNPSQDTKACTFTLTCKKCSTKVVNGESLTCTMWSHVDATCTATGSTTYRATGSYTAANSDYSYSSTNTNVYTVAALGHGSTGYTESYSWTGNAYNDASQDTKACTFTLTCKKCSTKVVNGASLTCIKTAHDDASCTETGSTTYQATGSYTAANSAYNYSATKTHEYPIAALGHSYGAGAWSWADDGHTATCTRTCGRTGCYTNTPGHTSSKSVTLGNGITSAQQVAPKCTEMGTTRYTATATVEGTQYSAAKDVVDIAALGHGSTGYTPTYTWGGTYDAATCTFTLQCGSCGGEVFNDNITTSKVQANHVDATCGKAGNERWTATGSYSKTGDAQYNGEAQAKDYAIPATGLHTFADDDLAQGHCTVCNHGFFRYTAEEKVEPRTPENLKDAEGQGIYDKEKHTFDGKNGVMEFDKPLVTIGEKAFFGRYQFEGDLIIPNTVTTIEKYGFNGCEGYTGNLIIPSSVTTIGEYAFCFCNFTDNLTIPNNINLGKGAFANCKGFNGTLTVSTPNIGERAFGDCSGFTELILSNSVETIGKNAFADCSGFSGNLNIPGSVTSIGYGAFSGCSGFTGDLTIPNSVTSVASVAFRGCSGFNGNLTIPNDINKIETAVFKGCSGLTGTLTIPSSVKEIGNSAFDGCAGLTGNLTIPSSVTSIEWEAFRGCSGFTGIEMNSVPQTGTDAFNSVNCTKAVVLSDDSYVYTGENPYFPTIASVTAPCNLDLTGSVVADYDITRTHTMVNGSCTKCDFSICDEVSYLDANGKQQTVKAIKLTADMEGDYVTTNRWGDYILASGWYYVEGELDLSEALKVQNGQEVNIILTDGCQWTLNRDISVYDGATLNIYWQSQKTGTQKIVNAYTHTRVSENATVNVYGGNFVGNDNRYDVLDAQEGGNLHIFDANVSGRIYNFGIVTIDGGTFKAGKYALHTGGGAFILNGGTFTGGEAAFAYYGKDNTVYDTFFKLGSGKAFYDSEGNAVKPEFEYASEGCISTLTTYIVRSTSSSDDDEPASLSTLVKTIEKLKDPNSGVTIEKINEIVDKLLGREKQDPGNTEDLDEEDFVW